MGHEVRDTLSPVFFPPDTVERRDANQESARRSSYGRHVLGGYSLQTG